MTKEESFVRSACDRNTLYFSEHAYEKMRKLKISQREVIDCIKYGILVEQQNGYDNEDPRMVFYNGHEHSFYVVVTVTSLDSLVITVCQTDFTKWEKEGKGITRVK